MTGCTYYSLRTSTIVAKVLKEMDHFNCYLITDLIDHLHRSNSVGFILKVFFSFIFSQTFSVCFQFSFIEMNHQLSGYSEIVWACVSVVQSGERSLPIVYFRRLLSDGCSCSFTCSTSMAVGSNERLLKLIIC